MHEKTIGKITVEYNVTARALRFYEKRGLLQPRHEGMVRLYSGEDCLRLGKLGTSDDQIRDALILRRAYADLACHLRQAAMGLPPRLPRLWHV